MSNNIKTENIYTLGNINNTLSNVAINNSIKIPYSAASTNLKSKNSNAGILIKDINSNGNGNFYMLNVNSNNTVNPQLFFNNNVVIDGSNLLSELEYELIDNNRTFDTSNISVGGGYINFINGSIPNSNIGNTGVGLRYSSSNTMQFKNYNTDWINLEDITKHDQFSELNDVNVSSNPLLNNQYITYNATSNLFVNSNLSISNDLNPTLGGNLKIGNNLIHFSNTTSRLVYNTAGTTNVINNDILTLKNNTYASGHSNYLEINNSDNGSDPAIIAKSTGNLDTDIGLSITATGSGNITLNAQQGNINANCDSLQVSGFNVSSIYRTSTNVGGYIPDTTFSMPLTNDTVLFDFINSSQSGTYWANVNAGIDGQKLNLIYNNTGSNVISVLANFGSNGAIIGTGYVNGLIFNSVGQSSSLMYLGNGINAWQVLNNTISSVF